MKKTPGEFSGRFMFLAVGLVAKQAAVWVWVSLGELHSRLAVTVLAEFFCGFFPILLVDQVEIGVGVVRW